MTHADGGTDALPRILNAQAAEPGTQVLVAAPEADEDVVDALSEPAASESAFETGTALSAGAAPTRDPACRCPQSAASSAAT